MAFKERIIDEAKRELVHVTESIVQTPSLIDPLQQILDDYKIPASRYDKRVAELTILVNEKVRELEVLTGLISSGGVDGCGKTVDGGDDGPQPVGVTVQYDVVIAGRNDSEDTSFTGINPYGTSVYGGSTAMTTGTNPTTIITANLGIGVTTRIGTGSTFFAQESEAEDEDSNPCSNGSGLYSVQRTALLNEIATRRATRDAFMNKTVNSLKNEMKSKYTQRHSHVWGRQKAIERKAELENLISIAEDSDNASYFT